VNISSTLNFTLTTTEVITLGTSTQNFTSVTSAAPAWLNGTGSGQVDLHCETAAVTLASGATNSYALSALTDSLGRTVALAKVRAFALVVVSRTAGDSLQLGDPGATIARAWASPFGGSATGKSVVWDLDVKAVANSADGFAVVSGTADTLLVKNIGSNPITYKLSFDGTSV
jgi:hypothetical protein